jgi:hypothetical protein
MLTVGYFLTPEVFSGRIVRLGPDKLLVVGNYTGGPLGDGSSGAAIYVTPSDPDYAFYDKALGDSEEALVSGLVLAEQEASAGLG